VACLWAAVCLGSSDAPSLLTLAGAAAAAAPQALKPSDAVSALWACSMVEALKCAPAVVHALYSAVERCMGELTPAQAHSVLLAHFSGLPASPALFAACWAHRAALPPAPLTPAQSDVSRALEELGLTVSHGVPILDGLLTVDIAATPPCSYQKIAVVVDGPSAFLRSPLDGGRALLHAAPAAQRLRLIQENFGPTLLIPFYEFTESAEDLRENLAAKLDMML
jgi:hypothetical protein